LSKQDQLQQFDRAYEDFVSLVKSMGPDHFLRSLGDWTPRDIVAHLVGWNHNIRLGCQQIQTGAAPSYHSDAPNDYRNLNAEFIARYNATDQAMLLGQLAQGKDQLRTYLAGVAEHDWDKDFGAKHYRGGPATVGRSVESLTGDYLEHAREISQGTQSR
jgi:hypothetical protein